MSTIATTIAGPKTYSAEELQALHLAMNAKAKRKKMLQKTALVTMNLIVCLFMLFPLLYTISVAFMPSGELYTMAMNIVPKHPTLENFVEAFHKIPLCIELIFGCGQHYAGSDCNVFSCGICLLFPEFQRKKCSVYAGHGDHDGAG